ncbi:MAG: P-loop NTPase [Caulobacteraceae bacterium]|nr:P-loop NTPase [Caulobacteraceae bacterium]
MSHVVVVGNEKGGAGKTTVAAHLAVALMHRDVRVAVADLDLRQRSLAHFFASRESWAASAGANLPMPARLDVADEGGLAAALDADADILILDAPGADTELSRAAHRAADLIVTPMNDSFMDFDVLGVVDPVTFEVVRPSHYAEVVWDARKRRAAGQRRSIDWVVLRNRMSPTAPRNRRRLDERLAALARRVGFRSLTGLRDRVIYRELYPFGLTVGDLSRAVRPVEVSLAHIAARQELRVLLHELGLAGEPAGVEAAA